MNRYLVFFMGFLLLVVVVWGRLRPVPSMLPVAWETQTIATDVNFRGLCAVDSHIAWVSGPQGTFGLTRDGGRTWTTAVVAEAEALDFRDVEAFSASTAYLLSAGEGERSRIYKTTDGGQTWAIQFTNPEPKGFYDAFAFWDEQHGLALGDPVGGHFQLLATDDGGAHWRLLPATSTPAALPHESAFAASGTCLITTGQHDAWLVTGGATTARLFHSRDRGQSWTVADLPLLAGRDSAGAFSIAFRDRDHGIIVGGDYKEPSATTATVAYTADGGYTWTLSETPLPFCSGVVWASDRWLAVGTQGSHVSYDDGRTWHTIDTENNNVVHCSRYGSGWVAGPKGRLAKLRR